LILADGSQGITTIVVTRHLASFVFSKVLDIESPLSMMVLLRRPPA
jgi:hypothetical protein